MRPLFHTTGNRPGSGAPWSHAMPSSFGRVQEKNNNKNCRRLQRNRQNKKAALNLSKCAKVKMNKSYNSIRKFFPCRVFLLRSRGNLWSVMLEYCRAKTHFGVSSTAGTYVSIARSATRTRHCCKLLSPSAQRGRCKIGNSITVIINGAPTHSTALEPTLQPIRPRNFDWQAENFQSIAT